MVTDRVGAPCPACSTGAETAHELLADGGQATVRCLDCGHVHKTTVDDETVTRDVVVSQDGDSFPATVEVPPDEPLAAGDEFVLETDQAVVTVRITSLEVGDARQEEATAADVTTLWTRDVGNVRVSATLHPPQGARDAESRSVDVYVPGDRSFVVGEEVSTTDERFEVESVLVRDDAVGYPHEKLDHEGDAVAAKDIKRIYARDTGLEPDPWSAW
jgi:uncharacterized Zn finger protein